MEPFSVLGAIILLILILSLGDILIHSLRFLFCVLLVVLLLVYMFNVSFNEVLLWFNNLITWAL